MPGGEMDYKVGPGNKKYEDFGNFNYGAVALAFGFSEKTALRGAGLVQVIVDISNMINKGSGEAAKQYAKEHMFDFLGREPYGDQRKDQEMIKQGFRYYNEVYSHKKSNKMPLEEFENMQEMQKQIGKEEWDSFFSIMEKTEVFLRK